ncbi:hypothetical protein OG897_35240 [Streptomyces sp. NBC_00237]|uniref:hypothetical protein n=1 Tax=Streptomyces sp. NBC_00237 TaxID=2975687 RepID=UPI00225AF656|nr:hypothetical protein [Streptomyces sp. NBC_00237]MCX5206649.1 hypothetical protein [Streptomyces sp. NBC_00237]
MSPLPLPPVPEPFQLPFHYGALHHLGIDWLVDPEPVHDLLAKHHPDLTAAEFGGRALVSFNYQLYFAQYAFGGGVTQEIEYNVVAFPSAESDRIPRLTYAQYAQGWDQTKLLGIARIHVLCDNPFAIEAGRALYAEPKHPGWFEVDLPSLNGPAGETWTVHGKAAETDAEGNLRKGSTPLFSLTATLDGLPAAPANTTPVTGYGTDPEGRLLAGPMNVYQPYRWYDLAAPEHADRVRLSIHAPDGDLGRDARSLVADTPAAGAWTYQSPPVAAHNRPYYLPARPPAV